MKRYVNFKSLSFWAGLGLVIVGLLTGVHEVDPDMLGKYGDILDQYTGGTGAYLQILTGLGFIGIRRKLEELNTA